MKICVVSQSFYPYIGGVTRYLQALGRKLLERGDEMMVVHLKTPEMPDYEVVDGIRVYRMAETDSMHESMDGYLKFKELIIDVTHGSQGTPLEDRFSYGYSDYLGFNLSMYEKVRQVYEVEKFDVLHVHDFQVMPLAFLLRGEMNVPVIFTWHIPFTEAMPPEWREFLVRYMRYYDRIIFSTDEFMRTAVESGLNPNKVLKINPFIETAVLSGGEPLPGEVRRPGDNIVLCVSRMDPRKGQEFLIKAMAEVAKGHPDTTCIFIGNGSMTKKLVGRTNRLEELKAMVESWG